MNDLKKNDEYDITRKTLVNITAIRSCFKQSTTDSIDEIIGKLLAIKEEKEAEFRQYETEAVARNEKRIQAVELLEAAGLLVPNEYLRPITAELLATGQVNTKKASSKGKSAPAKARLAWKNPTTGEWETYSRGRTANWIAVAKEAGETDETLALYAKEYNDEIRT
ncbi:hypothetical protein [Xenorhabdus bovienii]|uniref:H-NS family histone-like protein n=1 Tax=Xenorhabdus bovienii TaxID=40576 RepID=UPI0023B268C3|nr:hypothetical protein [Xenorhabdus bovienii]MDE9544144.1 hypothetical protein [Xenorhabdus bovienii]